MRPKNVTRGEGEGGLGRVGKTVSRCAGAYRKEALGRDGLIATRERAGGSSQ
jgi:hypothetical protein